VVSVVRHSLMVRALGLSLMAGMTLHPTFTGATEKSAREYILWYRNYDSPAIHALVRLALDKTPEYGPFIIKRSEELSQGRVLRELAANNTQWVDIVNVATSAERELSLTAIPVPVDGGLLGFRVCLIMPKNLEKFDGISNLQDLKARDIRIGQGAHWPDTPILESSGITVVTHARYEILFGMLRNNRFDCFARGVGEVLIDMDNNNVTDMIIEPDLLIAYPMPSYLFTAPDDFETAQRLELGLERAISDGSFGAYLKTWFGTAVSSLNLGKRKVIRLQNPYLGEDSAYSGRQILENLRRRVEFLTR